jgi:glycosyltransferase involved in cell wall biosynthesis
MRQADFKPALVDSTQPSHWGSCKSIVPNLSQAYSLNRGGRMKVFRHSWRIDRQGADRLTKEIFAFQPTHLSFIYDRQPNLEFFKALQRRYGKNPWPTLLFHVFGGFTICSAKWREVEKFLVGKRILFICASPRQKALISSFVKGGNSRTTVCPFPISADEYVYEAGLRNRIRRHLGVRQDETVILYTGRLSIQKNVLRLVWSVAQAFQLKKKPFKLILAGNFDGFGTPIFGPHPRRDLCRRSYLALLKQMPPEIRKSIFHVGQKNKEELRGLYHATDIFASLSTHHDEDYGMSPLEALVCGTPALLSDWGGFEGFSIDRKSVQFVPVHLGPNGAALDVSTLNEDLLRFAFSAKRESVEVRKKRSKRYLDRFGMMAVGRIFEDIWSATVPRFDGFTPLLHQHAQLNLKSVKDKKGLYRLGEKTDPNYERVYRHYCSSPHPRESV